jgi:hypothetical protein
MKKAFSIKQKVVFGLTTGGLLTVLTLMAMEGFIRIIQPTMNYEYMPQEIYVSHFRPSDLLPFELRPNNRARFKMLEFDTTVTTNSFGLRDNEVDFTKPRILCMGDSFTFGFGVENEETFCASLEKLFHGKYDFVNMGFADGYSPDTYALWLAKYSTILSPHGILVSLFQNDLTDVSANTWLRDGKVMSPGDQRLPDRITKTGLVITEDGAAMRKSILAKFPPVALRWLKQSYLVAFLRDRLLRDIDRSIGKDTTQAENDARDEKFIRALDLLRQAAGDRLLIFYIISAPENEGKSVNVYSHMDALVTKFAGWHGITVLSNGEELASEDFFPLNLHFNKQGHMKAAHYLHKALVDQGL